MRKYLKRLILFTMVLSLLIQTTQIPAMASTVGDSQNHSLESETTNYEMVATNDFGAMLKNSIQEEQETDSDYNKVWDSMRLRFTVFRLWIAT